ncbi:rhomboid family protein [Halalkalibacillus sediminis]|uniref:rhomboid family protein n=1 Tax=Halalkalibacillus sediminis TaxID=2018042 RepID=UPI00138FA451|nr:rhomboid family intramembrane serine protease [Halalkalibacillus sediminis]
MYVTEQYLLLKTVDTLQQKYGFRTLFISDARDEFLLEKYDRRINHVICIRRKTFDWSNQLKQDIDSYLRKFYQQPQLFRGKETRFSIVYVSNLKPVDSWEHLSKTMRLKGRKNATVTTYFVDEYEGLEELGKLTNTIDKNDNWKMEALPPISEQERQMVYLEQKIVAIHQHNQRKFEEIFQFGKTKWTFVLIIINLIVFFLMETQGSSTNSLHLIDWGAKYNYAISEGEIWRFLTSMFLHIGIFHLMMNMIALYFLGEITEKIYGSKRFLFIYFLAGFTGGIASYATNDAVAAGASGAIFGLFGALLFFGLHYKELFFQTMGRSLLIIIGINIVFGLAVPQIDNGAHIGGLIGGFIASQIIHLPKKTEGTKQVVAIIGLITLMSAMFLYGSQQTSASENPQTMAAIAQEYVESERYAELIDWSTDRIDQGIEHEFVYFYRAVAYLETDRLDAAEDDLFRSIEINEDFAEAHYNLSVISERENEIGMALEHVRKAIELQPANEQFKQYEKELSQKSTSG